jgi:hypothetical protein
MPEISSTLGMLFGLDAELERQFWADEDTLRYCVV